MVNDGEFIAIFNSIHRVMKAEKSLKGLRLPILLIPAPRAVSSDCGLAIRYSAEDREAVETAMDEAALQPDVVYVKRGDQYVKVGGTA